MSDEMKTATLKHFSQPNTIPNLADAENISREVAARRVKRLKEEGALRAVGKENRDNTGTRGQRPVLYQIA